MMASTCMYADSTTETSPSSPGCSEPHSAFEFAAFEKLLKKKKSQI